MNEIETGAHPRSPVIWLVDDDDELRQALAAALVDAGYQVVQFPGSVGPLEYFDAGARIDMLIADIRLGASQPHGIALMSLMRTRRPGLPCLLITAHHEIPDGIGNGVALMRKPVVLECFAADVRTVLGR